MQNQTADTVMYHLGMLVLEYNCPHTIQMDNGANLCSSQVTEMLDCFGVNARHITSYNKSANGKIENVNRLYQTELRIFCIRGK